MTIEPVHPLFPPKPLQNYKCLLGHSRNGWNSRYIKFPSDRKEPQLGWNLCFFAFKVSGISSCEQLLRMLLACIQKARNNHSGSRKQGPRSRLVHGCSLRGRVKVKLLFTFSSPEHPTRVLLSLLLSAFSLTLLLFPWNFSLSHYLCFLQQMSCTGHRVKKLAVTESVAFVPLPSDQIVEVHHFHNKSHQPPFGFHLGPRALFPYFLFCLHQLRAHKHKTYSNDKTEEIKINQGAACGPTNPLSVGVMAEGRIIYVFWLQPVAALGEDFSFMSWWFCETWGKSEILVPIDFVNDPYQFVIVQTWIFKSQLLHMEKSLKPCFSQETGFTWWWRFMLFFIPWLTDWPVSLKAFVQEDTSFCDLPCWSHRSSVYVHNRMTVLKTRASPTLMHIWMIRVSC